MEKVKRDPHYKIPDGLNDLLQEFAVHVLIDQPTQLVSYAADYFASLQAEKEVDSSKVPKFIIMDSEKEGELDELRYLGEDFGIMNKGRRISVSAERYDPESGDNDLEDIPQQHEKTEEQAAFLRERTQDILMFKMLDEEQLDTVIKAMKLTKVSVGEKLICQGDEGDFFYVIECGVYDFYVRKDEGEDIKVNTMEEVGFFGELALMYSQPRNATCIARTSGKLWTLDRQSFQRIVIKEAFRVRLKYEALLKKVPFLEPLDEEELGSVIDGLVTRSYASGQPIIRAGDEGDGIYFIETGDCSVRLPTQTGEEVVRRLYAGQYFGELALLDNSQRTASVYAEGRVKTAYLARKSFERLLGPCCDIMKRGTRHYKMGSAATV